MADGKVIIEASLDDSDVRRDVEALNEQLGKVGETMPTYTKRIMNEVGDQFDALGRRIRKVYKGTSPEAQRMSAEMRSAFAQQRVSMNGLRDDMIKVQYGYFQMAQGAKEFTGTNEEFMTGIETMGKKHKKINDEMMAANDMQRMSFYQSVGSMLSRSTQASKISENFTRMGNPLYNVNQGLLRVADNMNKVAMQGQPAALALKMLGPTANMKKLKDMTAMISQGIMRFQMIALGAAIASAFFYKAIHDGAMQSNKAYATAFKGMLSSVREAFQPMIDVFAMVMTPIYNFIKAVADMVIKFNEAHPMLAKIIQGFLLLIPILTLLLAPLAIGIGLFGGLSAAMAASWAIMGPIITGLAAMMGTVLLVAAAIVGLAAAFYLLWTRNETFRNGVIAGWDAIKSAALTVFNFIKPFITSAMNTVVTYVQTQLAKLSVFWDENGAQIMGIIKATWGVIERILGVSLAVIVSLFKGVFPIILTIVKTTWAAIKTVISIVTAIIGGIIKTWLAIFRGDWGAAWNSVKTMYEKIWNAIKSFLATVLESMLSIIKSLFELFKSVIKTAMNGIFELIKDGWGKAKSFLEGIDLASIGKDIIQGLINGIDSMIGAVGKSIKKLGGSIKDGIAKVMDTHSPSRWMETEIGEQLPAGIAVGVEGNTDSAVRAMQKLGANIQFGASSQAGSMMRGQTALPSSPVARPQMIDVSMFMDGELMARITEKFINTNQQDRTSLKIYAKGGGLA